MSLDDLRRRAAVGDLSAADVETVARHLHAHQPARVREAAIAVAGAYLARESDPGLMFALIAISESDDEDERVRTAAVRALARATGYHGQPVRFDL